MKYKITDCLHMPPDILAGAMLISLQDNRCLFVENFSSIVEYSSCEVKLQGKNLRLVVTGNKLTIHYFTPEECSIMGQIDSIGYEIKT